MVSCHAGHLWKQGAVAERMVEVTCRSMIRVGIRRVGVEITMEVGHSALNQRSDGVLFGICIEISHDEDIVVSIIRFVVAVCCEYGARFLGTGVVIASLTIFLVGILTDPIPCPTSGIVIVKIYTAANVYSYKQMIIQ